MGFWTKAAFKIGSHLSGRALIPWGIHVIRCRGSLEWGLVPRMDKRHELLEEVLLQQ
jgi:hypothetical protein